MTEKWLKNIILFVENYKSIDSRNSVYLKHKKKRRENRNIYIGRTVKNVRLHVKKLQDRKHEINFRNDIGGKIIYKIGNEFV